jgi:hypothetical protein
MNPYTLKRKPYKDDAGASRRAAWCAPIGIFDQDGCEGGIKALETDGCGHGQLQHLSMPDEKPVLDHAETKPEMASC